MAYGPQNVRTTMLLLLIRHGDAGSRDETKWPDDTERPLTKQGDRQTAKMAKRLRRRGYIPTVLLSSPWVRAWQTAEVVAQEFEDEGLIPEACEPLATMPRVDRFGEAIGTPGEKAIVALVGHEPWLGELASRLLTSSTSRLQIDFPKSGVIGVELEAVEGGAGKLMFFWRPKGE
jgi:phosphohistidine phosphatase